MTTELILKKRSLISNANWTGLSTPASPTGWVLNDDGTLTHTAGVSENLDQSVLFANQTFRIELRVTGRTAGTLTVSTGVGVGNDTSAITANGVYQIDLVAGGSSVTNALIFRLAANSAFDGTVSWITVVQWPGTWSIDLKEDVAFPITYNIADIREPAKRNTSYSKSITLPGTDNNNRVLGQLYEISQDGTFNPNKFTGAVVLQDGLEVFSGVMQVTAVNRVLNGYNNYDKITYNITLLGRLTDIFLELGDSKLTDLDFSEWDHVYNRDNQEDSWVGNVQLNGGNYNNYTFGTSFAFTSIVAEGTGSQARVRLNGLTVGHGFTEGDQLLLSGTGLAASNPQLLGYNVVHEVGVNYIVIEASWNDLLVQTVAGTCAVQTHVPLGQGYVYPMIDYGSVGTTIDNWKVEDLRPAIYLKEYIDKMFASVGFSYTSNFFLSPYFCRLIIPSNTDRFVLTEAQINDRLFRASYDPANPDPQQTGSYVLTGQGTLQQYYNNTYAPDNAIVELPNDTLNGCFDNGGNFNTTTYRYTVPLDGYYDMNFACLVTHTPNPTIAASDIFDPDIVTRVTMLNITQGNNVAVNQLDTTSFYTGVTQLDVGATNTFLYAGDEIEIQVDFSAYFRNLSELGMPIQIDWTVTGALMWNYISNPITVEGNPIQLSQVVPRDVYNRDLLSSVINAFNLYVVQDPSNTRNLLIEPRDDFYTGNVVDWTEKLDVSNQINLEPMGELQGRTYLYTYKTDKDQLNKLYNEVYNNRVYGDQKIEVDNDFIKNQKKVELIFSASVLAGTDIFYYGTDKAITQIYVKDSSTNQPKFIQSNIRLLWFSLLGTSQGGKWYHNSITDPFYPHANSGDAKVFYPYAGHLDKPKTPIVDLNFGFPYRTWYSYNSYTANNLYNKFHRNFVEEVTDKDSKLVTAYFALKASDILTLDFASLYWVDGHLLRLNKVIDYNPVNTGPTKCEFITVKSGNVWEDQSEIGIWPGGLIHLTGSAVNLPAVNDGSMTYNTISGSARDEGNGIVINGYGNITRGGEKSTYIQGDGNDIGQKVRNVFVQGNNNIVYGGLENVTIINTDGVTVSQSNVSWINGVFVPTSTGTGPTDISGAVQTTDATLTDIILIDSLLDDQTMSLEVMVSGMGLASPNDAVSSKMFASFYKNAGTVTQIGATTKNLNAKVTQDTFITTDGTNVLVQVQGVAATTIEWNATGQFNIAQA